MQKAKCKKSAHKPVFFQLVSQKEIKAFQEKAKPKSEGQTKRKNKRFYFVLSSCLRGLTTQKEKEAFLNNPNNPFKSCKSAVQKENKAFSFSGQRPTATDQQMAVNCQLASVNKPTAYLWRLLK